MCFLKFCKCENIEYMFSGWLLNCFNVLDLFVDIMYKDWIFIVMRIVWFGRLENSVVKIICIVVKV